MGSTRAWLSEWPQEEEVSLVVDLVVSWMRRACKLEQSMTFQTFGRLYSILSKVSHCKVWPCCVSSVNDVRIRHQKSRKYSNSHEQLQRAIASHPAEHRLDFVHKLFSDTTIAPASRGTFPANLEIATQSIQQSPIYNNVHSTVRTI